VIVSENVIQVTLAQVAIVHARRNSQRPFHIRGNLKLITHQRRPAGLDRVVIGDGVDGPDLMIVHKAALDIHGPVGEAVCSFIKRAVGLQEAAMIDLRAPRVPHHKLHPWLV
jgi:hypothetical protein